LALRDRLSGGKSANVGTPTSIMHLWAFKDRLAVRLEIVLDVPTMQAALRLTRERSSSKALTANDNKLVSLEGCPFTYAFTLANRRSKPNSFVGTNPTSIPRVRRVWVGV